MPQQLRRSERGFTIIETVISLVVMMVVGLSAASLFLYSVRNNSGAAARTQAIAYAQQMMERVRALDVDDPVLDEGENAWTCVDGDCTPDPPAAATATATASAGAPGGNPKANGKKTNPKPTPTPSPSPTPDGDDDDEDDDNDPHSTYSTYSMTMSIELLDDVDSANPPRKRITMEFRPNMIGAGDNQQEYWANNPVRVVVVRSARGVGRYRQ